MARLYSNEMMQSSNKKDLEYTLKANLQVLNRQEIIRRSIEDKEDEKIKFNTTIYFNNVISTPPRMCSI